MSFQIATLPFVKVTVGNEEYTPLWGVERTDWAKGLSEGKPTYKLIQPECEL